MGCTVSRRGGSTNVTTVKSNDSGPLAPYVPLVRWAVLTMRAVAVPTSRPAWP